MSKITNKDLICPVCGHKISGEYSHRQLRSGICCSLCEHPQLRVYKGDCPVCHKVSYPTLKSAQSVVKRLQRKSRKIGKVNTYICKLGNRHVGHKLPHSITKTPVEKRWGD